MKAQDPVECYSQIAEETQGMGEAELEHYYNQLAHNTLKETVRTILDKAASLVENRAKIQDPRVKRVLLDLARQIRELEN